MLQAKRFLASLLVAVAACSGGSSGPPGPFDDVPVTETVRVPGVSGPIDIVRDKYGTPHVYAGDIGDLGFGTGYAIASDRLVQMDLFRHAAEGRISELFGALDRNQIDGDLEMRMHMMYPISEQAWAELQASSDPTDQEIVTFANRYADGVNQFIDELNAGEHPLDDAVLVWFDPQRMDPWTPVDSLAIGRLQAWALSYMGDEEIRATRALQRSQDVFTGPPSSDLGRRAMAWFDILSLRPMDLTSTIDGFPNNPTDTGTRAKTAAPATALRPHVSDEVLANAELVLRDKTFGNFRLRNETNGSNNWIVGPSVGGGKTLLANDTHLPLTNPAIFYMMHLTIPGKLDVEGVTFPGVPVILLGHNQHIAWGATVVFHDITDVYQENIFPCSSGTGNCVMFRGAEVPLETRTETIKIGAKGTIVEQHDYTYEIVPHHGPIIPTIANHEVVPRTSGEALSVKFPGYEVTQDVRALWQVNRAATVADAFDGFENFTHGGMNWVIIDDAGGYGWTTIEHVPWRTTPGCYTFSTTNLQGVSPYLVLPGDGTCEWEGWMDQRYVPHAINPDKGFLVTANADPVGATFDGDPLNGDDVGDPLHRLYAGAFYDPGFRVGRITRLLQEVKDSGQPVTVDDMARIQGDTRSSFGEKMTPFLLAAVQALSEELATPGTHPDLQTWAGSLTPAQAQRITDAANVLSTWTFETPPALDSTDPDEINDSAATSIFNLWAVGFLDRVIGDELAALGEYPESHIMPRALLAAFERPNELVSGLAPETDQPVLCDELGTTDVESCTLEALMALDGALDRATNVTFSSPNMSDWRWGYIHTLTLESQLPSDDLKVPPPDDPMHPGGYPRQGDQYSVDNADPGYTDYDFSYAQGPAIRHITEFLGPGQPHTRFALPGGQVFDRSSPHYRDQFDDYWTVNQYFDFPFTTQEIIDNAEGRVRIEAQ